MEPLTNTELAILGLLTEGGPQAGGIHAGGKHAYRIEQDIANRGMRAWTEIGFSSIYYVLNKLEASGLLESTLMDESEAAPEEPGSGLSSQPTTRGRGAARRGPARRVYRITPAGWEAFHAAVCERLAHPRPRTADFELGLANMVALPREEALAALETYRADLRERIAGVRAKQQADRAASEQVGQPFPPHVVALFERSLYLMQAELDWIEGYLSAGSLPGRSQGDNDEHIPAH